MLSKIDAISIQSFRKQMSVVAKKNVSLQHINI